MTEEKLRYNPQRTLTPNPPSVDLRPNREQREADKREQDKRHERWIYLEDDGKMGTLIRPSFFDKASAEDSDLFCPYDSDKDNPGKCGSWCALLTLEIDNWDDPRVILCNGRVIPVIHLECGSPERDTYQKAREKRRRAQWQKK